MMKLTVEVTHALATPSEVALNPLLPPSLKVRHTWVLEMKKNMCERLNSMLIDTAVLRVYKI